MTKWTRGKGEGALQRTDNSKLRRSLAGSSGAICRILCLLLGLSARLPSQQCQRHQHIINFIRPEDWRADTKGLYIAYPQGRSDGKLANFPLLLKLNINYIILG